jgi:hypothetical protein
VTLEIQPFRYLLDIKRPEYLGDDQPEHDPGNLTARALARTHDERIIGALVVIGKGSIILGMIWREPSFGSEVLCVMEEALTAVVGEEGVSDKSL